MHTFRRLPLNLLTFYAIVRDLLRPLISRYFAAVYGERFQAPLRFYGAGFFLGSSYLGNAMSVDEICRILFKAGFSASDIVIGILYAYRTEAEKSNGISTYELDKVLYRNGITPTERLNAGVYQIVRETGLVIQEVDKIRVKPVKMDEMAVKYDKFLRAEPPAAPVDQDNGFIPKAVWEGTRGHLEKVAVQINGCYQHGFYDAASMLLRKLVEMLLVECYKKAGNEAQIKNGDRFKDLNVIITHAIDHCGLRLTPQAKPYLTKVREYGNLAAHNPLFTTHKADLDKEHIHVRVTIGELIELADLKRTNQVA